MKRILILIVSCILSVHAQSPENTVICCDIHGVVTTTHAQMVLDVLWQARHKFHLLKVLTNPRFYFDWYNLAQGPHNSEQIFTNLTKKYQYLEEYEKAFYVLANGNLNLATVEILTALQQKGYTIVAATNSGNKIYEHLLEINPQLRGLFTSVIMPNDLNNNTPKPGKEYYLYMQAFIQEHYPQKTIIFIDNSKTNIKAFCRYTAPPHKAILFKKSSQLRTCLANLGIL